MGAVAELAFVIIALVAAILAWASWQLLRPVFSEILNKLPLVGAWLSSHEQELLNALVVNSAPWVSGAIYPLQTLIRRLEQIPRQYVIAQGVLWDATFGQLQIIRQVLIPQAEARADAYTDQRVAGVGAASEAAVVRAERYADQIGAGAETYTDQQAEAAVRQATHLTQTLQGGLEQELAAEHAYAQALAASGGDNLSTGLQGEALARTQALAAVAASLEGRLGAEQSGRIQGDLSAQAAAEAAGQAAHAYTDQQTGALAASGAAALAGVAAAVRVLEDSACMRRCETLGGLGAAIEAIDLAALLGLVALCIEDPPAATAALRGTMVPIVEGAEAAAQGLVGVAFPGRA